MPVSKNRRRKNRKPRNRKTADKGIIKIHNNLYLAEHPFNQLPKGKLKEYFLGYGEECREKFPGLLTKLDVLAKECDPLLTLATFAFYGLITTTNDKGFIDTSDNYITQHNIELFHAFILKHKITDFARERLGPHQQTEVIDLTKELAKRFQFLRLTKDSSEQDLMVEKIRSSTQVLRNWSYFTHVLETIIDLIAPLDTAVQEQHGVSAVEVIQLCARLKSKIEEGIRKHVASKREILAHQDINSVISAYYRQYPDMVGKADELAEKFKALGYTDEQIRYALFAHHDYRELTSIFRITRQDLLSLGATSESVDFLLDNFSLSFGDLADKEPEHLFLGNPVWKRPLINLGDNNYFISGTPIVFSFIFGILEEHFFNTAALKLRYFDRRARYLEDKAEEVFKRIYPDAQVFRGSIWKDKNTQYENDLAIKVGRHLILVEAKAGRIAEVARRGGFKSLTRALNDIVVEPSKQSERFKQHLLSNRTAHEFSTDTGAINTIDTTDIESIVRLNLTLDEFGLAQSRVVEFQEFGLIDPGIPLAPTLHIADLDNIAQILDHPMVLFYYLMRREEIEPNIQYEGDEMDLLGIFLENGFNMDGFYKERIYLNFVGMSSSIDSYFSSREQGLPTVKPSLKITETWLSIMRRVYQREGDWLTIGLHLLRASYSDQRKYLRLTKKLDQKIYKRGEKAYEKTMLLVTGPSNQRYAFAYRPFKPRELDRRRELLEESAGIAFSNYENVKQTLVICRSLSESRRPYTTLGLFKA